MSTFWSAKAKRTPADKLFSDYIRTKAGWKCQYKFLCNGSINYENEKSRLHNSHFQKRAKRSTRFDQLNCDASCNICHAFVEDTPEGQKILEEFKRKQLGETEYRNLIIRANTPAHIDKKLELMYVKGLIQNEKKPSAN